LAAVTVPALGPTGMLVLVAMMAVIALAVLRRQA
jgi:hypothetical protein